MFLKRLLKFICLLFLIFIICFIILLGFLMITEYKPKDIEIIQKNSSISKKLPDEFSIMSWNIGYAGLNAETDFFMDGGTEVLSQSKDVVENNLKNIVKEIKAIDPTILMIQEVDKPSKRSFYVDEYKYLNKALNLNNQFSLNYKVKYVPYPFPPLGKVESGIYTASEYLPSISERYQLYVPFKFPVKLVNLKRGLLINKYPLSNGKSLILINLHLEAYDDGSGKRKQSEMLMNIIKDEYSRGNYVIAGGDWNQTFDMNLNKKFNPNPVDKTWKPNELSKSLLNSEFKIYYDSTTPSYRTDNKPYIKGDPGCYVGVIDGFMVSPNVDVTHVKTLPLDFKYSDHNPVLINVKLK